MNALLHNVMFSGTAEELLKSVTGGDGGRGGRGRRKGGRKKMKRGDQVISLGRGTQQFFYIKKHNKTTVVADASVGEYVLVVTEYSTFSWFRCSW